MEQTHLQNEDRPKFQELSETALMLVSGVPG